LVLSGSLTQDILYKAGFSPERDPKLAASVVDKVGGN
jgi:hypothetical protein